MDPVSIHSIGIDYRLASLGVFHAIFLMDFSAGTRTTDVARAVRNMLPALAYQSWEQPWTR